MMPSQQKEAAVKGPESESNPGSLSSPAATADETGPLTFTVNTGPGDIQYSEATAGETLSALRRDILQGRLSRYAATSVRTRIGNQAGNPKFKTKEGTLLQCALSYPELANLYMPVRRHAAAGLRYGILIGVLLHILFLALVVYQTNQTGGLLILALPIAGALNVIQESRKIQLPPILMLPLKLAPFAIPWYLGSSGLFPMLLGAAFAGAVLFSMPGMAIGAAVGAIRRPGLPRALDASYENAALRIAIPLAVAAVLWTAYLYWAQSYLTALSR